MYVSCVSFIQHSMLKAGLCCTIVRHSLCQFHSIPFTVSCFVLACSCTNTNTLVWTYLVFGDSCDKVKLDLFILCGDTLNHGKLTGVGTEIGIVGQDRLTRVRISHKAIHANLFQVLFGTIQEREIIEEWNSTQ